jgi:hypothetical protein
MIRAAIMAKLAGSLALQSMVGNRIYAMGASEQWKPGANGPAVIYTVDEDTAQCTLDGLDGTTITEISIAGAAVKLGDALGIARVIRLEWVGFQGSAGGVKFDFVASLGRTVDYFPPEDGSDVGIYYVECSLEIGHSS